VRLRGQILEAEAEYRRLTGKYPGRAEAHLSLCMLLEETADFARLEKACQDALMVAPTSAVIRLALARSMLKRNAPEQALHEMKLIDPQRLDLVRQIRLERTFGRALEAINEPVEAQAHYLAARKLARDNDAELVEPDHAPEAVAIASPAGAELVFLLGLPGSGVEVIGRVLQSIDPNLVHADRLAFDIRRTDLFMDAVQTVLTPLSAEQVETERARYQLERAKLPLHAGVGMDWVPGSAQCLSLINELYPLARVVLVERDPRDCVAEVISSGALVQTAPLDTAKLARSIKRSQDLIKPVKARLGKRLFCLNANEFIDRPEPSLAALNRFLGTEFAVPEWLQEQRTGDPWGVLRAAGSWKSLEAGWSAETLEALGVTG
jgi:Sulfotransferase family